MKIRIVGMLVGLLCWSALAQTQDQLDVTAGLADLCDTNLVGANAEFTNALAFASTNEQANALVAVTRLLLLPAQPAGSNFLNGIGFSSSGRNVYDWTSTLPVDNNGDTVFPSENTSVMIAFYRTNIMAALGASRTNLGMITDTNFNLTLSACETSLQAVTVDYGDILLLQALERMAEFLGYTLNAQNFDVVISQLHTLSQSGSLNYQSVLSTYSSFLTQNSASDLAASEGALTNAIALYFAASDFIRNVRAPGAPALFNLSPDETNNEALFRTQLTNLLTSLNQPVQPDTNQTLTVYAGAYFAGTHSPRSLLPKFNGDIYVDDTLPDYTFGGILGNEPAYLVEEALRKQFHSYAGIYIGDGGLSDNQGYEGGSFAVFVSTNMQATVLGYDLGDGSDDGTPFSAYVQFPLDKNGNWSFQSNSVSGFGSIGKDGSLNGELDYTNGTSVYLNGSEQPALGTFQNVAGYYSGTFGGSDSGTVFAIVAASGELFFQPVNSDGSSGTCFSDQLNSHNSFTNTSSLDGTVVSGTLNSSTLQFTGNYNAGADGSGSYSMSRSGKIPFDVPPVITRDLASALTASLGTNLTISLVATGSPPMCFQWYSNSVAIPGATTNSLLIDNLQYADAGTYAATINNCAGETNSALLTLTVVPETVPPTNQITAPTPGLQVSNANYTVTGKAGDNVAVSNVWVQLNNGGWNLASTANQWANWTAPVTLTPGSNTVQAYAVDTSGNVSATNTVIFKYVVSASLTLQLTGRGTITPNDSNAVLEVGSAYSITAAAVAGSGFAFSNWTGGTSLPLAVLTNGATLKFVMASNLVLQANFVNTNRPVISITNLTDGLQVSNASYTVRGTATDNVAVASVWVQLNNGGWNLATTANQWANWTAPVTLTPGSNTFQAYAVDTSGNVSATNTVVFKYVVSAPLTVQLTGRGTVTPNYSNNVLQVGSTYSMTAAAVVGSGFEFTNWTGGTSLPLAVLTNGATLKFVMVSNLVLQADFVDTNRPVVSITNLTDGLQVSNANYIVRGTATDNVTVASVWVQLNNGGWNLATTANQWANWTAPVTLTSGSNTFQAYAVDTSGNVSATNTVLFDYVVSATLKVSTNGLGTLTPNDNGASLQIGKAYSIVAAPGTGFDFTNWTGGTNLPLTIITNGTTVQFVMVTNLMLQANFVDIMKPTVTVTAPAAGQHMTNALAYVAGTASDNWKVTGVWYQLNSSSWSLASSTNSWTNWTTVLKLVSGSNTISAYAVDLGGNFSPTNSRSVLSSNTFKLLLDLTNSPPLAGNGFDFTLQLSTGLNGHIQVSTNLLNWTTLTNFAGTNATDSFRDPAATNGSRFYRAVVP